MSTHLSRTEKARTYRAVEAGKRYAGLMKNKLSGKSGERGRSHESLNPQTAQNEVMVALWQDYMRAQSSASPAVQREVTLHLDSIKQKTENGTNQNALRVELAAIENGGNVDDQSEPENKRPKLSAEAQGLIVSLILILLIIAACSNPSANQEPVSVTNQTTAVTIEEPTVGPQAAAAPEAATAESLPDETENSEVDELDEWRDAAMSAGATPEANINVIDDELAYVIETIDNETTVIVLTRTPEGIQTNQIHLVNAVSAAKALSTPENTLETPTSLEIEKTEDGDTIVYGVAEDPSAESGKIRVVFKKVNTEPLETSSWEIVGETGDIQEEVAPETEISETEETQGGNSIVDYSDSSTTEEVTEIATEEIAETSEDVTGDVTEQAEEVSAEETETQQPAQEVENIGPSLEAAQAFNPNVERIASGGTQYGFDSSDGVVAIFNQEKNEWEDLQIPIEEIEEVSESAPNFTGGYTISATVGKLYIPEGGKDLRGGNTSLVMIDVLTVYEGNVQVGQVSLVTKNQAGEFLWGKDRMGPEFGAWLPEHWLGWISKIYYSEHVIGSGNESQYDAPVFGPNNEDEYILGYFNNPDLRMPRITPGDTLVLSLKPVGVELPSNPDSATSGPNLYTDDFNLSFKFWGPEYENSAVNQFMNGNDFSLFADDSEEIPTIPSYLVEFYEDKDHQP